jgi:phosphoribosylaminoimidazole-succinocarboxamide synthase
VRLHAGRKVVIQIHYDVARTSPSFVSGTQPELGLDDRATEARVPPNFAQGPLPPGLKRASKLPEPIFTPATKAEAGHHDENISFERMAQMLGEARAKEVRDTAVKLYRAAAEYALARGIIIADTKFEFGVDDSGKLHLIDEALTPDSSRFWPLSTWKEGASPESFDKQYVRNWLDAIGFERKPPAPAMPPEVAAKTSEKYQEAARRLMA